MQKYACLSIDVEVDPGRKNLVPLLFSDSTKLTYLKEVLQRNSVPLTAFVVMRDVNLFKGGLDDLCENIEIELGTHSYSHIQKVSASKEEVDRSFEAFSKTWGYPPLGYRAPNTLINHFGLKNLIKKGYYYDGSIVPSMRFDEFHYNNWSYPRTPFKFIHDGNELIELPVATMAGIRIPLIFSYVKLFGLNAYKAISHVFPFPEQVVLYFHPYDLYPSECKDGFVKPWKRFAHLRNSGKEFKILDELIKYLLKSGYKFITMGELAKSVKNEPISEVFI